MTQITKTIHQIWYDLGKGSEIPNRLKEYQKTWLQKNPTWKYILWNEEMGDNLIKQYFPQYFHLYKKVKYPIMKCDIIRYIILYVYGGIYVDLDYWCHNSLDSYFTPRKLKELKQYEMFVTCARYYFINNALIMVKKPFSKIVLKMIHKIFWRIEHYPNIHYMIDIPLQAGPLIGSQFALLNPNKIYKLPKDLFDWRKCSLKNTKPKHMICQHIDTLSWVKDGDVSNLAATLDYMCCKQDTFEPILNLIILMVICLVLLKIGKKLNLLHYKL